ncbi:TetR family transcriptional regulator [Jiella sp. M17.18]|uniref:TetR family transcriptional regulator n=1 Tax=Jiella sp. M17.18 TaxID=3234247 RepID=UPI0034E026A1
MRRTKQDALRTREMILDAAETLFYEQGVASTTLTHIANAAGLTRGAIYWHFPNKLELFRAMHERAKLPQEEFFRERPLEERPSLEDLFEHTMAALHRLQTDERMRKVLTIFLFRCEYVGEMEEALTRRNEADEAMRRAVAGIFEKACREGKLKAGWCSAIAANIYFCAVAGIISEWLRTPGAFDLEDTGRSMIRTILGGCACSSFEPPAPGQTAARAALPGSELGSGGE